MTLHKTETISAAILTAAILGSRDRDGFTPEEMAPPDTSDFGRASGASNSDAIRTIRTSTQGVVVTELTTT